MNIFSIKDSNNKKLFDFLKFNFSKIEENYLIKNYHPDFSNVPGNFFYILDQGRYKNSNYFILEENEKYYGSAGWNPYEDKALLLTRAYIPKEYRNRYFFAKYLLPIMFEETISYNKLWITCNDYNKSIYNAIERLHNNKSAGLFNPWPKIYSNFKPIGKHMVNNTMQYVAEYLRKTYEC